MVVAARRKKTFDQVFGIGFPDFSVDCSFPEYKFTVSRKNGVVWITTIEHDIYVARENC
jgi:hypothetical protein